MTFQEKMERAYNAIQQEIEDADRRFVEIASQVSPDENYELFVEASEEFMVAAQKTYAKLMKVLQTFVREVNTTYTKYTAQSDTKKIIEELADYCLVHGTGGAGDVINKKKANLSALYGNYIHELSTVVKKSSGGEISLEKKDILEEKIAEIQKKYVEMIDDMEEEFGEEAKHMTVTQSTVDAVSTELKSFQSTTKKFNDEAVAAINDIYRYINSSEDRRFVSIACKVCNMISLFSQKVTMYYVRYPFKVMTVLRRKIKGIEDKDKKEN